MRGLKGLKGLHFPFDASSPHSTTVPFANFPPSSSPGEDAEMTDMRRVRRLELALTTSSLPRSPPANMLRPSLVEGYEASEDTELTEMLRILELSTTPTTGASSPATPTFNETIPLNPLQIPPSPISPPSSSPTIIPTDNHALRLFQNLPFANSLPSSLEMRSSTSNRSPSPSTLSSVVDSEDGEYHDTEMLVDPTGVLVEYMIQWVVTHPTAVSLTFESCFRMS